MLTSGFASRRQWHCINSALPERARASSQSGAQVKGGPLWFERGRAQARSVLIRAATSEDFNSWWAAELLRYGGINWYVHTLCFSNWFCHWWRNLICSYNFIISSTDCNRTLQRRLKQEVKNAVLRRERWPVTVPKSSATNFTLQLNNKLWCIWTRDGSGMQTPLLHPASLHGQRHWSPACDCRTFAPSRCAHEILYWTLWFQHCVGLWRWLEDVAAGTLNSCGVRIGEEPRTSGSFIYAPIASCVTLFK